VKRHLTNWWVLAVGATLLASLALFLLCGFLVAALLPARWWLILLAWTVFAGAAAWRWQRKRRARAALEEALAPADTEGAAVAAKLKEAVAKARSGGRGALYQLPWYVIIGPPGAGKTTLIQKSGLRLLTEEATAGVGGTRNCDWWFTDEAVLIDTAGRYTAQDSEAGRDAKSWQAFLAGLRKARPLQPLNGVIVAIGLDEIAAVSADALDRHIVTIRARLAELSRTLGLELPVYLMLTKADLVAGFTEFTDDLTVEGRRSVVGHTLALDVTRPDEALLTAGYDEMAQALADRVPARLQAEGDPTRRGAVVTFPPRIADLRARVVRLMTGVFGQPATGEGTRTARLRGFYLTSGVQQGTPFDRLLGTMSASLARGLRPRAGASRAFFVNRLLKEVVIAEAGLAAGDIARRRRETRLRTAAIVGLGALAALLLIGWTWSLFANLRGQRATVAAAGRLADAAGGIDANDRVSTSATLPEVLDLLDGIRDGLPYGVTRAAHPPLGERWGLYRRNLADESQRAYYDALQRYLLPRLVVAAERALVAGGGDPIAVYDPLKVYLMLGNRAGAARDAHFVLGWLDDDLSARELPGPENEEVRKRVLAHATALLADSGRFGRDLKEPVLDGALVERAQATVAAMSSAQRALALMRQQVDGPDWRLVGDALLPGEAGAFGNPREIEAATVPFLFTKAGFAKGFVPRIATVGQALEADRWMLGDSASAQAPLDRGELARLYAAEYARQWNGILALPQPGDYARDTTALARLANPSASPLKKITDGVIANTQKLLPAGATGLKTPKLPGGALGRMAGQALRAESGLPASQAAARDIEAQFQTLRDYAAGPTAPVVQLFAALGKYQLALAQAAVPTAGPAGAAGGGAAGIGAAAAELGVAAANAGAAVPALGSFVKKVATGSSSASETQRTTELRQAYQTGVLPDCATVMGKGYPFGAGADLQPADVSRVVGLLDGFGRDQLGPGLDRTGKAWRWVAEPTVASFSPASAQAFQRAAAVQAMMGGNLVLRIAAAPTNAKPVRLRANGVVMDLAANAAPERLSWSSGGSQVAEVSAAGDPAVTAGRQEGPWALFRLLDAARRQALAPNRYRFFFSPASAVDVEVAGGPDPFAAGGPFALRCPAKL